MSSLSVELIGRKGKEIWYRQLSNPGDYENHKFQAAGLEELCDHLLDGLFSSLQGRSDLFGAQDGVQVL